MKAPPFAWPIPSPEPAQPPPTAVPDAVPRPAPTPEVFHTLDEVAAMLGVSTKTLRRRIKDGSICKVPWRGRLIRIPATEIARLVGAAGGGTPSNNPNNLNDMAEHYVDIPK